MQTFHPENSQSSVDFLAFSVARMEMENSSISARSVASSMPPAMADTFFKRLRFYRLEVRNHPETLAIEQHASATVTL